MEAPEERSPAAGKPVVLFACVHNAGRSQMAAAFARTLGRDALEVRSDGSEPAERLNPAVVAAMAEVGIDLGNEVPKRLSEDGVREADVVVTMGCGESCPFVPGKRYIDWAVDDPADRPIEVVREIRDDIRRRVAALLRELSI